MRRYPHLYEINARTFINRLKSKYGRSVTLNSVPDEEWQGLARRGFDLVWLMGVWRRSPLGRQIALRNDGLRRELDKALPGWTPEDLAGSAYSIVDYSLDPALGGRDELVALKAKLNRLGLGLILDFIPNHQGLDHPWTVKYPDRFVGGLPSDVQSHPDWFYPTARGRYLAHGRDPNFAPWHDTAQVDFFSSSMRKALASELRKIAAISDGVRCDMAMLALNDVFGRVWGEVIGNTPRPQTEFWAPAIEAVKKQRPGFLFMAEVYWGLDRRLQELGFDFTYDKALYDSLIHGGAGDVSYWITSGSGSLERGVHFIENHDEPRAVVAFGRERSMAAAVVIATTPGVRFYHDGQLEGWRVRAPVHLARELEEVGDEGIERFYAKLLSITDAPAFHDGEWVPIGVNRAWDGNQSHRDLLAWYWRHRSQWKVIAINYSPHQSQGWLKLPPSGRTDGEIALRDELTDVEYVRNVEELNAKGLYVDLKPYQAHLMDSMI